MTSSTSEKGKKKKKRKEKKREKKEKKKEATSPSFSLSTLDGRSLGRRNMQRKGKSPSSFPFPLSFLPFPLRIFPNLKCLDVNDFLIPCLGLLVRREKCGY